MEAKDKHQNKDIKTKGSIPGTSDGSSDLGTGTGKDRKAISKKTAGQPCGKKGKAEVDESKPDFNSFGTGPAPSNQIDKGGEDPRALKSERGLSNTQEISQGDSGGLEFQGGDSGAGIGMAELRKAGKVKDKWGAGSGQGIGNSGITNDKYVNDTERPEQDAKDAVDHKEK